MKLNEVREKINFILENDLVAEKTDFLVEYIPEIKYMIGFEQKHPHHNLDVWEHTKKVIDGLKNADLETKMAGLLHDIGKPFSYQDEEIRHFHGHAKESFRMSKEILKRLEYDDDFIENVGYLVSMHDTIIDPNNLNNSIEMTKKLLQLQYADSKAHHPDKIKKRIDFLDSIEKKIDSLYNDKNGSEIQL